MSSAKFTRRKLAASLAASAGMAAAQSQRPSAAVELQMARQRLQAASHALERQDLPISAAPAFQFKP